MKVYKLMVMLIVMTLVISACATADVAPVQSPTQQEQENVEMTTPYDKNYTEREGRDVIYLAGGCFWGLEKLMQSIPGVVNVVSGYANGKADMIPDYQSVCTGQTGYRETVRVEYEPEKVSLDALLFAYYHVINPTVKNQQGPDIGSQYQTGVYYIGEEAEKTVQRITDLVKNRYENFYVEIEPLERFYDAEEYHQNYLDKNPGGYCHISRAEMNAASSMIVDPGDYPRPSDEEIKASLTDLQYHVTQQNGTEPPFQNEYWENHERGIYVDVVTGEPLFSSSDKFDSGTGWPSFTKGIDENTFFIRMDDSLGMRRYEVRSRAGNSHLGHVFYNDPVSPSGTRFCINSAALSFIPFEEMEAKGYGYLLDYVK